MHGRAGWRGSCAREAAMCVHPARPAELRGWRQRSSAHLCPPPLQVYGTMIELFDCRRELYTATEVVANNSLFHVVVSRGGCLGGHGVVCREAANAECAPCTAPEACYLWQVLWARCCPSAFCGGEGCSTGRGPLPLSRPRDGACLLLPYLLLGPRGPCCAAGGERRGGAKANGRAEPRQVRPRLLHAAQPPAAARGQVPRPGEGAGGGGGGGARRPVRA